MILPPKPIEEIIGGVIGFFLVDRVIRTLSHSYLALELDTEAKRCRLELAILFFFFVVFVLFFRKG